MPRVSGPGGGGPRSQGFRAELADKALPELIQMECLAGTRRVVRVSSGSEQGFVYFDQGSVVHAELGARRGTEALFRMLRWDTGSFQPVDREWPATRSIHERWEGLLMRAAQERDEENRRPEEIGELVTLPVSPRAALDVSPRAAVEITPRPAHPPNVERPVDAKSQAPVSSSVPAVRLDATGNVVASRGETDDLAGVAAYVQQLAGVVGESLGMDAFEAVEAQVGQRRFVAYRERSGSLVALLADRETDLSVLRQKYGL